MYNDLISVIVPIYKVEDYLDKCVDSILNQTYSDLEIFLVDDGSPDSCGEKCDEYAKKDARVRVIHKTNGGLSDARNVALDKITGKYVTFIDSDDYVGNNYIKSMYEALVENDADLAVCSFAYIKENGEFINRPQDSRKVIRLSQKKALYEMLRTKYYSNSAWGKLYRSDHFKDIRYPKGEIYEDIPTTYKLFLKATSVVYVDYVQYYYLYRAAGISKASFKPNRMNAVTYCQDMIDIILKRYPDLNNVAECRLLDAYIGVYKSLNTVEAERYREKIEFKIKQLCKSIIFMPGVGLKHRLMAIKYILVCNI